MAKKQVKKRTGKYANTPAHLIAYRKRDDIVKRLGFANYKAYLESELWAEIRGYLFDLRGAKCIACGSTDNLQVHHKDYHYQTMLGRRMSSLAIVCASCHSKIEGTFYGKKVSLTEANTRLARKIASNKQENTRRRSQPHKAKNRKPRNRKDWFAHIVAEVSATEHAIVGNCAADDTWPSADARPIIDLINESLSSMSVVTAPGMDSLGTLPQETNQVIAMTTPSPGPFPQVR